MSSTRRDPEGDMQGYIPRYLHPSVFREPDETDITPASPIPSSKITVLAQLAEVNQADTDSLASPEATQAGLRAARAALAAAQSLNHR